jgi:hypothetical protein
VNKSGNKQADMPIKKKRMFGPKREEVAGG